VTCVPGTSPRGPPRRCCDGCPVGHSCNSHRIFWSIGQGCVCKCQPSLVLGSGVGGPDPLRRVARRRHRRVVKANMVTCVPGTSPRGPPRRCCDGCPVGHSCNSHRIFWSIGQGSECEHMRQDPKGGELCLAMVKPGNCGGSQTQY